MANLNNETKKVLILTHTDVDGCGSVVLAKGFTDWEVEYKSCNYTTRDINKEVANLLDTNEISNYDYVYITDISVNEENAKRINEFNGFSITTIVKLFDHHKTALWLNKYNWALVKVNREDGKATCGTELFYQYLINCLGKSKVEQAKEFVEMIRLFDVWDWKTAEDKEARISVGLTMLYKYYGEYDLIDKLVNNFRTSGTYLDWTMEMLIGVLQTQKDKYIKNKIKKSVVMEIEKYYVAVVFADDHISELGNAIAEEISCQCAMVINMDSKSVSLRSIGSFDVSIFAKQLHKNGGGHVNAGGCNLTKELLKHVLSNIELA